MSYRDQVAAQQAQIEKLEREIALLRQGTMPIRFSKWLSRMFSRPGKALSIVWHKTVEILWFIIQIVISPIRPFIPDTRDDYNLVMQKLYGLGTVGVSLISTFLLTMIVLGKALIEVLFFPCLLSTLLLILCAGWGIMIILEK